MPLAKARHRGCHTYIRSKKKSALAALKRILLRVVASKTVVALRSVLTPAQAVITGDGLLFMQASGIRKSQLIAGNSFEQAVYMLYSRRIFQNSA